MASKVITLSLKDGVEKSLRRLAVQKYGRTKGNLAKVVAEGVRELEKKEKIDPAYARFLEIMKKIEGKGHKLQKYKREELYER